MTDFSSSSGWSDPTTQPPPPPQDPYAPAALGYVPLPPVPPPPPMSPLPMSPLPMSPPPAGGSYGGYGGYAMPNPQAYYPPAPRTNSSAVASLVLSIVGMVLVFCYGVGGVPGLVGAIFGHVAQRQIKRTGEGGEGMAKAGIIIGWIAVALSVLILIAIVAVLVVAVNSDTSRRG